MIWNSNKVQQSERPAALIVAAGRSSRMGCLKPLLQLNGQTLIRRIIDTFQAASIQPIVVVTGNQAEQIERHIVPSGVICVRNYQFEDSQMFDSIKIGLPLLRGQCNRFFFTPADIPLFRVSTVKHLMNVGMTVSIPSYNKRNGHPILISAQMIDQILHYDGTDGLRGFLRSVPDKEYISVDDPGILWDADTPQDFQMLISKVNSRQLRGEI